MKILQQVFNFSLYSNIFISICASGAAYQTFLVAGETDGGFVAFVFCSTFVFYNLQRIFLSKNYSEKFSSQRHKWILKNKKSQIVICIIAFIISIPLINFRDIKLIFIFALFSIIATFYFIPQINLRAIPGLKACYISFLWVFSTVVFPLMLLQKSSTGCADLFTSLSFQRLFFILPLCIVFNVRDMEEDKTSGIKTLPLIYGIRITKIICMILLAVFSVLVIASDYDVQMKTGLLLSVAATAIFILFTSKKRGEYFYSFGLDGMILLQAGLVMLLNYF